MKNDASTVVSVRIGSALLDAVREQARADGRTVSGEIVHLVKEQIQARPTRGVASRPISGWLAHLDVPDTHREFRRARSQASEQLLRSLVRKGGLDRE